MSVVIISHGGEAKNAIDQLITASAMFGTDKVSEVDAFLQTFITQCNHYSKASP